jgi:hypothetical protein
LTAQVTAASAYVHTAGVGAATFLTADTSDEVQTWGTITTGRTIILTETGATTNIIGAITGTLVSTDAWTCAAYTAANGGGSATTTIASILSIKCTKASVGQVILNTAVIGANAAVEETTITLTTTAGGLAANTVVSRS